jgi:hypothetical protein
MSDQLTLAGYGVVAIIDRMSDLGCYDIWNDTTRVPQWFWLTGLRKNNLLGLFIRITYRSYLIGAT